MKIFFYLLVIVALVAGGYSYFAGANDGLPRFRTGVVETGSVVATVTATGAIEPITLVQVGSQISGNVEEIFVDFNDLVKAGDIICKLDQTALLANVAQDRANFMRAKANVRRVEAKRNLAGLDLKRSKKLFADTVISDAQLEIVSAQYEVLTAEVAAANAEVEQAKSAMARSETNLGYATIRSPIDGVVISRNIDIGQTVAASLQAPVLFEIAENLEKMRVKASISEADIGLIKPGQPVWFTVDAYQKERFNGEVLQIRLAPTVEQNVVTYTVMISATNRERRLLPGMTANIHLETGRSGKDALRVSNLALRFEPELSWIIEDETSDEAEWKRDRSFRILWIEALGGLKAIYVHTGFTDGAFTELTGGEIAKGQEVVIGVKLSDEELNVENPFMRRRGRSKKSKK